MSAKANNQVPSILGNSVMVIQTSSMDTGTNESYKVGDVIVVDQNVNLDTLKVGDCIAFYAPKASGFVTDDGNSLPIFHRIIRIIYEIDAQTEVVKRYFVCHGDSATGYDLEPAQPEYDDLGNALPVGDYDENGNLEPGGGYVAKLISNQAVMQYVTDDFVIGKLKDRAGGLFGGLVTFCSSSIGVILLVIIPSALMIGLIVVNLIQETKIAKKEREEDQLILAQNMSTMSGVSGDIQIENNTEIKKEEVKEPQPQAKVEQKPTAPQKPEIAKDTSVKKAPKAPKQTSEKLDSKVAPKATAKTAPKAAPEKAEAKPIVAKAPAKPQAKATETKSAQPKAVPAKSAPVAKPEVSAAPKKAPAATKSAPETKVPPKKG